jgi:hypothetical protein
MNREPLLTTLLKEVRIEIYNSYSKLKIELAERPVNRECSLFNHNVIETENRKPPFLSPNV